MGVDRAAQAVWCDDGAEHGVTLAFGDPRPRERKVSRLIRLPEVDRGVGRLDRWSPGQGEGSPAPAQGN